MLVAPGGLRAPLWLRLSGSPPPLPGDGGTPSRWPITSSLQQWAAAPDELTFRPPQSQCLLQPDGAVRLFPGWANPGRPAFLFDTASMPDNRSSCAHCGPGAFPAEHPALCCGVCVFEHRRCEEYYPGQGRSEAVAAHLEATGHQIKALSPCELFARIRGRTLWFVGDSQMWHFFYSIECFLREFAPHLRRVPAVPPEHNSQLITVTWPVRVPPLCLELALGSRVCAVRVDKAEVARTQVVPLLYRLLPSFKHDLVLFNSGLHYPMPGADGKAPEQSELVRQVAALAAFWRANPTALPPLIWMDTAVQHFTGWDGSYNGGEKPFRCAPLRAWYEGDATVRAGGRRNAPLAPLIPGLAAAHLRTWNLSIPLWATHKPGECTHWCSPSAYHAWLYRLNALLAEAGLGNPVHVPERHAAAAAEAAAVAAAEAAAAAGAGVGLHGFD